MAHMVERSTGWQRLPQGQHVEQKPQRAKCLCSTGKVISVKLQLQSDQLGAQSGDLPTKQLHYRAAQTRWEVEHLFVW